MDNGVILSNAIGSTEYVFKLQCIKDANPYTGIALTLVTFTLTWKTGSILSSTAR